MKSTKGHWNKKRAEKFRKFLKNYDSFFAPLGEIKKGEALGGGKTSCILCKRQGSIDPYYDEDISVSWNSSYRYKQHLDFHIDEIRKEFLNQGGTEDELTPEAFYEINTLINQFKTINNNPGYIYAPWIPFSAINLWCKNKNTLTDIKRVFH